VSIKPSRLFVCEVLKPSAAGCPFVNLGEMCGLKSLVLGVIAMMFSVDALRTDISELAENNVTEVKWVPCCEVKGACMKEDKHSNDGCPLGFHADACDCYWRTRGSSKTGARWRCNAPKYQERKETKCCCSNKARAALPSNDAYLDAYCAAPSKWYSLSKNSITKFSGYQSEYARVKKCKMSERTRRLEGEKKKTLGDYFAAGVAKAGEIIDDYRPRIGHYDALVTHTGTGQVGTQKRGYIYTRAGVKNYFKEQEAKELAKSKRKRRGY